MTTKQSTQLVKSPHTQKAIATLERFAKMEAEYKALEKESKKATELLKEAMIEVGVDKITFDSTVITGYITLAERINYKATNIDEVDEKYLKPKLDTDKVKAEVTLTGQIPAGVEESRTQYITKKIKLAE